MISMTKHDAINAAMSVAEDVADGRLKVDDLEQQAVTELRALFSIVVGLDDPAWGLQADVARQAIALGALTADELSEWAAVMRRRAGEPISESDPDQPLPKLELFTSEEPTAEEAEPANTPTADGLKLLAAWAASHDNLATERAAAKG